MQCKFHQSILVTGGRWKYTRQNALLQKMADLVTEIKLLFPTLLVEHVMQRGTVNDMQD